MKKKVCIIGGTIVTLSAMVVEGCYIHHYKKEYYKVLRMWSDEKYEKERKIKEMREMEIKMEALNGKYNDLKGIVNKIYGSDVFKSKGEDSEKEGEKENV